MGRGGAVLPVVGRALVLVAHLVVVRVLSAGAAVALLAATDLFTLPRPHQLTVSRQMQRVASLGNQHPIELTIDNRSRRPVDLVVREDSTSGGLEIAPATRALRLPANKRTRLALSVKPHRRGEFVFEYVYAQLNSWGGFWRRLHRFPCHQRLQVYPNIKQIAEYALLARTNRLSQIGVRRTRKVGQDNYFERLRDYLPDDNYRHIDWRSTARRQKLTVRQFQTDQSQRVIFLLDCGRMMTNDHQGISLLDYAQQRADAQLCSLEPRRFGGHDLL